MFQSLIKNKYFLCAVFAMMCNGLSLCSQEMTDAQLLFKAIEESRNQEACAMINANNRLLFSFDDDGYTLLEVATIYNNVDLIRFLLEKKASSNCFLTPLHLACICGNLDAAMLLIEKSANVNAKDDEGCTPLHYAARRGKQDLVELLVARDANVEARDEDDCAPLHHAAMFGREAVMSFLESQGGDVNAQDAGNITPLHFAVMWSRGLPVVELLIDLGADVNAQIKEGVEYSTPLHCAIGVNNIELAQLLLRRGADVDACNKDGETALHLAAATGSLAFVKLLIENGANIDARTQGAMIAIAICQYTDEGGSVQKMLTGKTPLHYAAERGQLAVVRYLIEKGANADAVTCYNKTALMLALEHDCGSVVAYFIVAHLKSSTQ